jgi:hypothetical protein
MSAQPPCDWSVLLVDAVTRPGIISSAYSRFWNYSVGNQILALFQCLEKGIEPGPIHTFKGWLDIGRHVRKGEKAITLCMPVSVKRKLDKSKLEPQPANVGEGAQLQSTRPGGVTGAEDGTVNVTVFTFKPHWFVLSQTEGEPYQPQELPGWSESRALSALSIERVKFERTDGNCQGFALERTVSVSPIAGLPHKTLLHEIAHVLLGHTAEGSRMDDHEFTPRNLREVEAECVALICCEALGLPGTPECRGYIQHWLGKETIPDRSAQRIFRAADQILRGGRPAEPVPDPNAGT